MLETDQQKKWLDTMRRRAELMHNLYARIGELSKTRDRQEIIRVASETLEVSPVENGNEVSFGSLEIIFSDDNEVVDIRSDDGTSTFSVKPLTGNSAG